MKHNIILLGLVFLVTTSCSDAQKATKIKPALQDKTVQKTQTDIDMVELNKTVPIYSKAEKIKLNLIAKKDLTPAIAHCEKSLKKVPHPMSLADIKSICQHIEQEQTCVSENKQPIFHYDRLGTNKKGKNILALSLIHGDEHASGTVTTRWIKRLKRINPRNSWRVIPVMNPDGWDKGIRMNAHGVDINRNFPSKDWDELALTWWTTKKKSDPRRYPGPKAASAVETRCLMTHINNFQPDFIISIHTPLGLLDFDGPKVKTPSTLPFPWQKLGNYPGSLGRYMWKDHNVPVLTIELKGSTGVKKLAKFDRLQDISGTVAMRASKIINDKKEKTHEH